MHEVQSPLWGWGWGAQRAVGADGKNAHWLADSEYLKREWNWKCKDEVSIQPHIRHNFECAWYGAVFVWWDRGILSNKGKKYEILYTEKVASKLSIFYHQDEFAFWLRHGQFIKRILISLPRL